MQMVGLLAVYAIIIGGMWFLLMRPQKKEQKRLQAMLSTMEVGDTALTTSGFYGVIIDITDDDVIVEFGNNKNPYSDAEICNCSDRETERGIRSRKSCSLMLQDFLYIGIFTVYII